MQSFSRLCPDIDTGSGPHLASSKMGTRVYFPGDKATRAWSWPLISS